MSETETGAEIGKPAPSMDSLESKTSANTVLAAIKTEAKKLIEDIENIPAEVRAELHAMWDAFHYRAATVISEAPPAPTPTKDSGEE